MQTFSEMTAFGIWESNPQTDIEMWEKLDKIEALSGLELLCSGDVTYGCLDLREPQD